MTEISLEFMGAQYATPLFPKIPRIWKDFSSPGIPLCSWETHRVGGSLSNSILFTLNQSTVSMIWIPL